MAQSPFDPNDRSPPSQTPDAWGFTTPNPRANQNPSEGFGQTYAWVRNRMQVEDQEPQDRLPAGLGDLNRRLNETNALIDRALAALAGQGQAGSNPDAIGMLGDALGSLFEQLDEASGSARTDAWSPITEGLRELASKVDRREALRQELALTQQSIDKSKLRLFEDIQAVARQEQERLSVTKVRSKMASALAERMMGRLK
ncbi:MAG: hypothetical protein RLY30_547 [Pseudomonadota bacterium]|jgi:hypothetical protein